jgi:DNA-binding HxlR family transcriptional regulator
MKEHFGCPVQATANTLAGKWKVLIVWHLSFRPLRFSELRALLPGVSEKVLTSQLRELARDLIVRREDAGQVPPRVDYILTPAGHELIAIMEAMCLWGRVHLGVPSTLPPRPASGAGLSNGRAGVKNVAEPIAQNVE